ncbi:MAG TPA: hypothetical protein ENI23_01395 [bacterium]|nr:hypothetical protein [bacterium]
MNKCPSCREGAIARYGESTTLIGYEEFEDSFGNIHKHDDNCVKQNFECPNSHIWSLSIRRKCNAEGCDWKGKEECLCHKGKKIDSFLNKDIPLVKNFSKMVKNL